jgi:hypothetical protein
MQSLIIVGALLFSVGRTLYMGIDPHHVDGLLNAVSENVLFDIPLTVLMADGVIVTMFWYGFVFCPVLREC